MDSGTSKKSELTLIGVARGSLEELLLDYEDYLRTHGLQRWPKDHEKALYIRKLARKEDKSYKTYKTYVEDKSPETAANTIICVIHQANFLLDRLKLALSKRFVEEGGLTERLYKARAQHRERRHNE